MSSPTNTVTAMTQPSWRIDLIDNIRAWFYVVPHAGDWAEQCRAANH